jgi:hypothetical protein
MATIIISVIEYHCGDYDYIVPESPPLHGAVLQEEWISNTFKVEKRYAGIHAEIDSGGKPIIVHDYEEVLPKEQWFQEGRNHHRDGNTYHREIPNRYWTIEINTLEEFIALFHERRMEFYVNDDRLGLTLRV